MQKAASLTKSSPMYSAPACSIMRKQLVDGLTEDTKTVFRMPTSPCGWLLSKPPHHNQGGGQLRPFWYVNVGWFRSKIGRGLLRFCAPDIQANRSMSRKN